MFQPKELFIGLRYTRAKRKTHFVSFIAFISIAGVSLGVFALIVVLSVMNGFGNELRDRTLSMTSHATITGFDLRSLVLAIGGALILLYVYRLLKKS